MTLRPGGDSHPRPVEVEEGAPRCLAVSRGQRVEEGRGLDGVAELPCTALQPPPWPRASLLTHSTAPTLGSPPAQGRCCRNSAVTFWLAVSTLGILHPTCRQPGGPNLRTGGCGSVSAPSLTAEAWLPEGAGSGHWGPRRLLASSFPGYCALSPSRVPGLRSKKPQPALPALGTPSGLRRRGRVHHPPPPPLDPLPTLGNRGQEGGRSFTHKGQQLWVASPHPTSHPHSQGHPDT